MAVAQLNLSRRALLGAAFAALCSCHSLPPIPPGADMRCRSMREAGARTAILLFSAALVASCDRAPPAPAPLAGAGQAASAPLKASDRACSLPLRHFAPSKMQLVGTMLDYPTNRLIIDRAGAMLWNATPVEPRVLEDYLKHQEPVRPPIILVVSPETDSPCEAVRDALAAALRVGRCTPQRCVFEWPGTDAPPAPPGNQAS